MSLLRRYLIAGLLVWVPLGVTFLVLKVLVDTMDRTLLLLPPGARPQAWLGYSIPGLGIVLTIVIVLLTGMIAANLLGRRLVLASERLLARIPLVRTIYAGVKQVMETVFTSGTRAFRKVLLVEYPRTGVWSLAFQTSETVGEVQARTGEEVINVFVPTTPNPTSGFLIMVPRREVIELDMSIDEGVKMIISLGVIVPVWRGAGAASPRVAVAPPGGTP